MPLTSSSTNRFAHRGSCRTLGAKMKLKYQNTISLLLFLFILFSCAIMYAVEIPNKVLIGYWHNWQSPNPTPLLLEEIPLAYDVIDVAFAIPDVPLGTNMQFTPDSGMYPIVQDFIDDVQFLQSLGKAVLISIGGATAPIHFDNSTDVQEFITSMSLIIDTYGFDGMDIDLEGGSLFLEAGDIDYRFPTTSNIVFLIEAVQGLLDLYNDDFILTMAPETAYVQGAYFTYAGVYGGYLPLLHAVRNELSMIYVQHYNTGSMYGSDGNIYCPPTADFHVAMADMLLGGFIVDFYGQHIPFDPLFPEQIAIGLPACPDASSSGYTSAVVVHEALNYIVLGESFGGLYQLTNPAGYPDFCGLMTWSINWGVFDNCSFSNAHRAYLDSLVLCSNDDIFPEDDFNITIAPNPVCENLSIHLMLKKMTAVRLSVYNCKGQLVQSYTENIAEPGECMVNISASEFSNGIYFIKIKTDRHQKFLKFIVAN